MDQRERDPKRKKKIDKPWVVWTYWHLWRKKWHSSRRFATEEEAHRYVEKEVRSRCFYPTAKPDEERTRYRVMHESQGKPE